MMINSTFDEKYRSQFHFTPAANWMNDPNGMVYFEGEYHLFYQYHPHSTTWGPMHWGHAISQDLIHWEHLPIALKPDQHGFIFSGSAVVDWKDTTGFFAGGTGLVAIFTHHEVCPGTEQVRQRQSIAYSVDKGRTWIKYEGNPVLAEEQIVDFRDPKVFWHEGTLKWVMVLAAGDHVRFYVSSDLKSWVFSGEFGALEGSHDGVWECPDLFELSDKNTGIKKWVLIVSIGDHPDWIEGSRTQYFIGHFDGSQFTNDNGPETVLWVDHGRDNYAGVSWSDIPDQDGRRVFIGWMSNWKYANMTPTVAWRSAMTIPRELSLRTDSDGIRLMQLPVDEMKQLRMERHHYEELQISPEQSLLPDLKANQLEIKVEFEIGNAKQFGLKLCVSEQAETIVGYEVDTHTLFIDRSKSGTVDFHSQFACKHEARLQPENGRIRIHLFLDWSSVEVFANEGKLVMTDLIFPDSNGNGLELFSVGGTTMINSLNLYTLKSIHADNGLLVVPNSN